jgi:hypothetical protein
MLTIMWLRGSDDRSRVFQNLCLLFLPIAAVGALLAVYNYLRFASPLEFGIRYALQGSKSFYDLGNESGGASTFLNPRFLPFNLDVYLLSLPQLVWTCPHVASVLLPDVGGQWPYLSWDIISLPLENGVARWAFHITEPGRSASCYICRCVRCALYLCGYRELTRIWCLGDDLSRSICGCRRDRQRSRQHPAHFHRAPSAAS